MKKSSRLVLITLLVLFVTTTGVLASGRLVIYSPATRDTSDLIVEMFNKVYPDIQVDLISAGTGELATRIRAERINPQGDILLTGGTETVDEMLDLIQPYKVKHDNAFDPRFKHPDHYYYAFSLPLQTIIVNTNEVSSEEIPRVWTDLLDPKWKGRIIMANPALSGSAYAQLNIMLQLYGWDYVEKFVDNATITSSSRLAYQNVANGEFAIGITGESNIHNLMSEGYPVVPVFPEDGTALRYDTVSMIKNGPNPENAKLFLDFVTSFELYNAVAQKENRRMGRMDVPVKEGLIPTAEIPFMDYDSAWAAKNKEKILEKFDDIFAAKK